MSSRGGSFWFRAGETVLLVMAFVLPLAFYLRAYDSALVKTSLFHLGALCLVFAWLLKGVERGRWEVPAQAVPLLAPAAAYLAWLCVRFAFADHKAAALPDFLQQVLGVAVFAAALLEFGGARHAARFMGWTLAAAWLAGLYGAAQLLGLDPLAWKGAFGGRIFSTLANPDLFAAFLALCLPLALAKTLDPERAPWLKAADAALLLLLSLGALGAGSADGLAAFTVSALIAALCLPLFSPSRAAAKASLLAAALAAGTALLAVSRPSPALERDLAEDLEHRRQVWSGTAALIAERPLVGHGPGSFFIEFPRHRPEGLIRLQGSHNKLLEHPSSLLLKIAAEQGLVGAALWLWLLGAVLLAAWRARPAFIRQGALAESCHLAGLFAAVSGFLVCSQFSPGGLFTAPGWLLWPLAGMLGGLTLLAPRGSSVRVLPIPLNEEGRRRLYAPALLAFAVLAAFPARWFDADVRLNVAIYHAKRGEWEQALAAYDRVSRGAPTYVMAQYLKGNAYLASDRPREALAQYAKLESLAPDYVLLHYQKAQAYARLGEWGSAIASHERQGRLDPLFADNWAGWAKAALAAGDLAAAKRAISTAMALEPQESGHLLVLSDIFAKERNTAAIRRLRREISRLKRLASPGGG